jgi:hypothetical protein
VELLWDYADGSARASGALPPERMRLPSARMSEGSPFRRGSDSSNRNADDRFTDIWRAIEHGYVVSPGDCPAVRALSCHGFVVRCPGLVVARRIAPPVRYRKISQEHSRFGEVEVSGTPWPGTDSGHIASWIAGSGFVKVHSGISVFFPADHLLYQGPPPDYNGRAAIACVPGLERADPRHTIFVRGQKHGVAELNMIFALPPLGEHLRIARGTVIGWFIPIQRGTPTLTHIATHASLSEE